MAQSSPSKVMRHAPEDRVDVYAAAVRGLSTLEPDPERQLKYAGRIEQADADTLLTWSERILTAERIDDIFC